MAVICVAAIQTPVVKTIANRILMLIPQDIVGNSQGPDDSRLTTKRNKNGTSGAGGVMNVARQWPKRIARLRNPERSGAGSLPPGLGRIAGRVTERSPRRLRQVLAYMPGMNAAKRVMNPAG
jgi:hypothetical protein